jgi:hypothetical protein
VGKHPGNPLIYLDIMVGVSCQVGSVRVQAVLEIGSPVAVISLGSGFKLAARQIFQSEGHDSDITTAGR